MSLVLQNIKYNVNGLISILLTKIILLYGVLYVYMKYSGNILRETKLGPSDVLKNILSNILSEIKAICCKECFETVLYSLSSYS